LKRFKDIFLKKMKRKKIIDVLCLLARANNRPHPLTYIWVYLVFGKITVLESYLHIRRLE
jgi:hypothetical protein